MNVAGKVGGGRLEQLLAVLVEHAADVDSLLDSVAHKLAELLASDIVTLDTAGTDDVPGVSLVCQGLGPVVLGVVNPEAVLLAVRSGTPVLLDGSPRLSATLLHRGVRTGVSVPLPEMSTVLSLYRCQPAPFGPGELALLTVMGRHLSLALRNARRLDQLAQLAQHSIRIGACRDELAALTVAVDGVRTLLDADASAVSLVQDGEFRLKVQRGLRLKTATEDWRWPVAQLAASNAIRDRAVFATTDVRVPSGHPERGSWRLRAALLAPVEVDGTVVALLSAYRFAPRAFSADDKNVVSLLAGQVAAAMVNTRLVHEAEQGRNTAELLRQLSAGLNSSMSVEAVVERSCAALLAHSNAERATMLLLDEDGQRLVPMSFCASPFLLQLLGAERTVGVAGSLPISEALRKQGRVFHQGDATQLVVQPLVLQGKALGVVLLEGQCPTALSTDLAGGVLDTVASMSAVALERSRLFEQAERSRMQLAALHDVAIAISSDDDLSTTLRTIVAAVRELTGAECSRIGLVTGQSGYRNAAVVGAAAPPVDSTGTLEQSVGAWVVRHAQSAWVPDTTNSVSDPPEAAAWINDHSQGSAVAVPIVGRTGKPIGFLTLRHSQPFFLARSCLAIVERFATEAGLAVENCREGDARRSLEQQLREQAFHDPLTQLANRALLLEKINIALHADAQRRHSDAFAVLFLDVDRFKTVNDGLGHAAGDELLQTVARRLCDSVRPDDVVARLGGDEFVILLSALTAGAAIDDAIVAAERLQQGLARPVTVRGHSVVVTASIGVTVAQDGHRNSGELLRDADIAMYRAKAAGKARVVIFDPSMNAVGRLTLESDLRRALDEQALQVHYQPIVALATGRPMGVEALVRWDHPLLGAIPPAQFVALAEETGMVGRLDQWVLETALRDIGGLRADFPGLQLNVNLSAVHLHEPGLPGRIAQALGESTFDPRALTLEITETAAMRDPTVTVDSLAALSALGVGVALDDFGTGHSNLGYLRHFALRGIKIDRSFVEHVDVDAPDAAIVAALITISATLALRVTAEGVETAQQQQRLLELGCRYAQGYLFARPAPVDELTTTLAQWRGR